MENALREYVNHLFPGAAAYPHLAKAKEELVEQAIQQYRQLVAEGKSEQEAFQAVIAGLGNPSGRTQADAKLNQTAWQQHRKKSAWLVTGAVMLYIFSIVPLILCGVYLPDLAGLGAALMFVIVALATGMLVYNHMSKPTSAPAVDTAAPGEFAGPSAPLDDSQKSIRRAISSALWCIIIAAYLLISFLTGAWYITWLIFLIGGALEQVIRAVLDMFQRP